MEVHQAVQVAQTVHTTMAEADAQAAQTVPTIMAEADAQAVQTVHITMVEVDAMVQVVHLNVVITVLQDVKMIVIINVSRIVTHIAAKVVVTDAMVHVFIIVKEDVQTVAVIQQAVQDVMLALPIAGEFVFKPVRAHVEELAQMVQP